MGSSFLCSSQDGYWHLQNIFARGFAKIYSPPIKTAKNTGKIAMQTTKDLIYKLESADYPLRFIAKQAGVSYTRLYRYMANDTPISPEDEARIRRFAIVQPCIMDGSVHDD